jgi:hypothetical protein
MFKVNHRMNADNEKNDIRFSNFKKLKTRRSFSSLGGKELVNGVYTYYYKTKDGKTGHGFVHLIR